MRFLARVFVSLKPTVSDPQGQTIRGGLQQLGFEGVRSVRAGKYLQVGLDASGQAEAERHVTEMCERLLANPLIEEFSFELERVDEE